jgi:hypothetical protein
MQCNGFFFTLICKITPNPAGQRPPSRLFGVNVPEHTVVDCEEYEPLNRPGPPDEDEPVTSRYLITWKR